MSRARRQRKATTGLQKTPRPLSATYRAKVRALYQGRRSGFRDPERDELASCVFSVMDELECRSPQHPQVGVLRAVMGVLQEDSGASEQIASFPRRRPDGGYERTVARWPACDAARAKISAKRRRAMTPEQRQAAAERLRKGRKGTS